MAAGFRCSTRSAELGEPMAGTASTVANWLLVEQPGPWGSDPLTHSRLSARVARHLRAESHRHGVRVILLRRPGRDEAGSGRRACFAVHTGPEAPWTARIDIEAQRDLLDLDLARVGSGLVPPGAERTDEPLLLVCTNGRRDPCCAERGRPLARALEGEFGTAAWECSHIGGDRFAGNLVCFPHGLYFGRLDPATGRDVARAYLEGRVDLDHYRGRSCHPFAVQAAEAHLRRAAGLTGLDDLRLEWVGVADDGVVARFAGPDGRTFEARVRVSSQSVDRPLTCHAERSATPPAYEVIEAG